MTTSRATTSRPPSVRPASAARAIHKRRDKPYKTEHSRVVAKKRKLNLHTTYTNPPQGFQFLSVGTPDLAERCKELSRQRGCPVNVVNAKPVSRFAQDPEKVSHHIHRIGYHFRSDVVDDACQELGYVHIGQRFRKESDLATENANSKMALAMKKYGLQFKEDAHQETDEQVKAAIKELFPKIPDVDLKAIMQHAWEEGSHRVGTNPMLELPRRVQLATIARIRHTYTDYDRLLKAFEWKDARSLVEPTCLSKLIEWRGEQDEEDDNELEEIVRETIVIDDDESAPIHNGSEADDEDSSADQGYASDTSLEISHKPAAVEDLGAESHDERSKRFLDRIQAPPRNVQQRYMDVTQKIGLARQRLRDGYGPNPRNVVRVHLPETPTGNDTIMIDGQLFRRASAPIEAHMSPAQPSPTHSIAYPYPPRPTQSRMSDAYPRHTNTAEAQPYHDRPVASIEPHDDLRRMALASASAQNDGRSTGHRSRPASPAQESSGKRRRIDMSHGSHFTQPQPTSPMETIQYRPVQQYSRPNEVIDLTMQSSPGQPVPGPPFGYAYPSPRVEHQLSHYVPGTAVVSEGPSTSSHSALQKTRPPAEESYDPRQPMLPALDRNPSRVPGVSQREPEPRFGFVDAQVAPIQYVPHTQRTDRYGGAYYARPAGHEPQGSNHYYGPPQPRVVYVDASRASYTPVHGAPAAVQQVPRGAPNGGHPQSAAGGVIPGTMPSNHLPVAGTYQPPPPPQQQQYYYPR